MQIEILRRPAPDAAARWQSFLYEPSDGAETVATALTVLNARVPLLDANGQSVDPIRWECSCLQKKCGACAMVINGRPALACDTLLARCGKRLRLEPLRKFPVVADLIVDRSILYENLNTLRLWLDTDAEDYGRAWDLGYEATRCLQCGCCLEVCPNFAPGGKFAGMAGAVPLARLLALMPPERKDELRKTYRNHIYGGCGKSLACRNVCPAEINLDNLLAASNAIAVWKRLYREKSR